MKKGILIAVVIVILGAVFVLKQTNPEMFGKEPIPSHGRGAV